MLDFRKLSHVVAVARRGGFTRAAESLHISQSSLTKSAQAIEAQLGTPLFERGARGVVLTPYGDWFIPRASRLLADAGHLEVNARETRELRRGFLRIGSAPEAFDVALLSFLPAFLNEHSAISVTVSNGSLARLSDELLHGDVDLIVGALDELSCVSDIELFKLRDEPVSMFVRRGHPLDRAEPPEFGQLLHYPMVAPSVVEPHGGLIRSAAVREGSTFEQPNSIVGSLALTMRIVECTDSFSAVFQAFGERGSFTTRFQCWRDWKALPDVPIYLARRRGALQPIAMNFIEFATAHR